MYFWQALHDGSLWFLLACVILLAGVIIALFTQAGSGIDSHPYSRPTGPGELASDLPPESIGRAELEPMLWRPRHPRRRSAR